MTKFTIYLELDANNRQRENNLFEMIKNHFQGATITKTIGLWENEFNHAYKIELFDVQEIAVSDFVKKINTIFKQDCCLVEKAKVNINFI